MAGDCGQAHDAGAEGATHFMHILFRFYSHFIHFLFEVEIKLSDKINLFDKSNK